MTCFILLSYMNCAVMNGNTRVFIVLLFFVICVKCMRLRPNLAPYSAEEEIHFEDLDRRNGRVTSTVFRTVNKFLCSVDSIVEGSHLIVYGTRGWTFPVQDVNLTLRYPTATEEGYAQSPEEYIITGFQVFLYSDGEDSEGYIIDGGVLMDSIALSFISSQVTSLRYMFWVYGVRKDISGIDLTNQYRLC